VVHCNFALRFSFTQVYKARHRSWCLNVVEGQMRSPRVIVVVLASVFCFLLPVALRARQGRAQRQMAGVPPDQALLDPAHPQPVAMQTDRQVLDARNQLELRMNVQRLYALATELKEEMDQTNSSGVLSATVLQRARDIEKLAKQIKDSARK
jgi:hypothetical protein